MKNKEIFFDVVLSNGVQNILLGSVSKLDKPGLHSILYGLCSSYPSSELYIFRSDFSGISDFLLNSFGSYLDDNQIHFFKRICKSQFFIRFSKRKGF